MTRRRDAAVGGAAVVIVAVGVTALAPRPDREPPVRVGAAAGTAAPHQPKQQPTWAYREPGDPVYFEGERFTSRDAVDASFAMRVEPYAELGIGDRFTVVLTVDNRSARAVETAAQLWIPESLTVRIDDAGGGQVVKVDDHNAPLGYRVSGVEYRRVFPRGRTEMRAVVRIDGFRCPGGGDFVSQVLGALGRPFVSGANNGDHLIWLDDDPRPGAVATCTSESVPNTPEDRERARR